MNPRRDDDQFGRLRRRAHTQEPRPTIRYTDPEGRRSLYSAADAQPPSLGGVSLECSECGVTTAVTPRQFLALAAPSVHLPWVRKDHGSWMRCPSCGERTWMSVTIHL